MSSWTTSEDVTLCECWKYTTHDRITGNEMDKREMWSKITKAFCDVHGENARTSQGLQGRWKKLNASFTCWKNAISHASNNLRSGTSLADQTLQAQAFYNAKNGNNSFNKWECWAIVKDCPRYKIVPVGPEFVMHGMGLHSSPEPETAEQEDDDTFEDTQGMGEEVPETQQTRQSLRPQGKKAAKASKKKGSSSRNDYTKYMEELARQGELNMAREAARDQEKAAAMAAILATNERRDAATERRDAAAERQREIVNRENEMIREALNRENEMLREERIAQADRDIMNKSLVGLSPNSKYFWTSEKRDVVRRRRARDEESSGGGSSYRYPSNPDPSTTYPSSRDFV